jgi:flagellar hook-basal body complex protein FliE
VTTVPTVSAATAAGAYGRAEAGQPASLEGFGNALTQALQGVVDTGHTADKQSAAGIAGTGNLTDVVTAVNRAELALQSTTAIRDRVVQAYQDIMRMPI